MGYDVHITRRNHWAEDGEPAITRGEWQAILASDSNLQRLGDDDTAQMLDPTGQAARCFWYSDGQISVKKPNRAVLMKMLAIAERLGARVIGDDDEIYSLDGSPDKKSQFEVTENW